MRKNWPGYSVGEIATGMVLLPLFAPDPRDSASMECLGAFQIVAMVFVNRGWSTEILYLLCHCPGNPAPYIPTTARAVDQRESGSTIS
jgi:hypothetical protein